MKTEFYHQSESSLIFTLWWDLGIFRLKSIAKVKIFGHWLISNFLLKEIWKALWITGIRTIVPWIIVYGTTVPEQLPPGYPSFYPVIVRYDQFLFMFLILSLNEKNNCTNSGSLIWANELSYVFEATPLWVVVSESEQLRPFPTIFFGEFLSFTEGNCFFGESLGPVLAWASFFGSTSLSHICCPYKNN